MTQILFGIIEENVHFVVESVLLLKVDYFVTNAIFNRIFFILCDNAAFI